MAKKINGNTQITENTVTDNIIGNREVGTAVTSSEVIVTKSAKSLAEWITGFWSNISGIFTHLSDLDRKYNAIEGYGGYLTPYDFGKSNPTQAELTSYALAQIEGITNKEEIFNGTHVKNIYVDPSTTTNPDQLPNNHVWVLTNTPNTVPTVFEWVDNGPVGVNYATNDTYGIIKGVKEVSGGSTDGYLSIDNSGNPVVLGYDGLKDTISTWDATLNTLKTTYDNFAKNQIVTTSTTFNVYIDGVSGDDSNDGKSSTKAFKTIPAALSYLTNVYVPAHCQVSLHIAAGTYQVSSITIRHIPGLVINGSLDSNNNPTTIIEISGTLTFGFCLSVRLYAIRFKKTETNNSSIISSTTSTVILYRIVMEGDQLYYETNNSITYYGVSFSSSFGTIDSCSFINLPFAINASASTVFITSLNTSLMAAMSIYRYINATYGSIISEQSPLSSNYYKEYKNETGTSAVGPLFHPDRTAKYPYAVQVEGTTLNSTYPQYKRLLLLRNPDSANNTKKMTLMFVSAGDDAAINSYGMIFLFLNIRGTNVIGYSYYLNPDPEISSVISFGYVGTPAVDASGSGFWELWIKSSRYPNLKYITLVDTLSHQSLINQPLTSLPDAWVATEPANITYIPTRNFMNALTLNGLSDASFIKDTSSTTSSPIIINPPSNTYNQGIRINRGKNNNNANISTWSGIIVGGKENTTENVDNEGYTSDPPINTTLTTGNGTWWIASDPLGDFGISMKADFRYKGLFIKRDNSAYLGSSYSINKPTVLKASELGIPATFNENGIFGCGTSPGILTLTRLGNVVCLVGYLIINSTFVGNVNKQCELTIPFIHLPTKTQQIYVMMTGNLNKYSMPVQIQPVNFYLPCPTTRATTGGESFWFRCPTITAGTYNECFINASWTVDENL
jgi:hypothetical protein